MQRGETDSDLKTERKNRWRQEVRMGEEAVHKGNLKMGFLCLRACADPPVIFCLKAQQIQLVRKRVTEEERGQALFDRMCLISPITQRD